MTIQRVSFRAIEKPPAGGMNQGETCLPAGRDPNVMAQTLHKISRLASPLEMTNYWWGPNSVLSA